MTEQTPSNEPMPVQPTPAPTQPKGPNAFVRFFRWLWKFTIRLILVTVFGIGIGALVFFYGIPNLFHSEFSAIRQNADQIQAQATMQSLENQLLKDRLSALQERLLTIEMLRDTQNQRLGEIEAQATAQAGQVTSALRGAQATQQAGFEAEKADLLNEIEALSSEIAALESSLADTLTRLDRIGGQVTTLTDNLNAQATQTAEEIANQIATLETFSQTLQVESALVSPPTLDLQLIMQQLQLLRAMEFVTKSRLHMDAANYGLAAAEVTNAIAVIESLRPDAAPEQIAALDLISIRLENAFAALPGNAVRAGLELDQTWELLMAGLPPAESAPEAVEEPTPTATPTP